MAEYTNFDLKKFLAENKQANVVKENTQGFDALMDAVDDYIDPSHPDHERLAQEVEKALDNGDIDTLEFSHSLSAPSREVEFIAKQLGIEPQTSEETVSEESGLASAAVQEFLAADSNGVTIAEFVKAMIDGAAASLGDEAEYYDLDAASQSILKAVGRGDLIGEETLEEAFKKQIKGILLSENKPTNSRLLKEYVEVKSAEELAQTLEKHLGVNGRITYKVEGQPLSGLPEKFERAMRNQLNNDNNPELDTFSKHAFSWLNYNKYTIKTSGGSFGSDAGINASHESGNGADSVIVSIYRKRMSEDQIDS